MSRRRPIFVALAITAGACGNDNARTPSAPPLGRVLEALLGAADREVAPWRCVVEDLPAIPEETVTIGGHTWSTEAHTLARSDDGHDGRGLVIGVVADAGGALPRTIASLGRLRAALEGEHPDVVIALGGMGATSDDLQATLGTLSDRAGWPVVALPGDLEPTVAHANAIAALRKRGDFVLDGRRVRWIELPGATIATVPGAGALERLAPGGDGCAWASDDVANLASELTGKPGMRIIASAEAPRTTVAGDPAGELALVPTKAAPLDVVLHGPVQPAPTAARSGSRDGAGTPLSPGTADATSRLPDGHRPSAGLLVLRGSTWSWRTVVDASAADH